jgi:NAD(P)-dependent dehydrogenase (short-subunit alcohol dehydrogenase family)
VYSETPQHPRFEGKIAIVTGAGCVGPGWGNGRAIAVRLAQEGARVLAVDSRIENLQGTLEMARGAAGDMQVHAADVTSSQQVAELVLRCEELFGEPNVLVNNVGGSAHGGPVELDEEVWERQLALNLTSVFLGCKHVIPRMQARGGGSIVNVASTSGLRWTGAAQVAYASAKAGVIQLSRVVAVQHAAQRIRVNTVVPGQLHTPMVEARLAGQRAGGDVDALLAQRQRRIPLGFMGDGSDTAAAALFLASDEARFITGTEIVVDGGMTVRCD